MEAKDHIYRTARIVLSILAAFFIVLNGRWNQVGEAVTSPAFFVAVCVSFCITYLLLVLIHHVSIRLDRRYTWGRNHVVRPILQLLLGVSFPLAIAVSLAALYISSTGQPVANSGYWDRDFPIILIFITMVNGFYPIFYFLLPPSDRYGGVTEARHKSQQTEYLTVNYNGNNVMLHLGTEVLYIYKDRKLVKLNTVTGTTYAINDTLANLTKMLADHHFCQINRSTIINTSALKGYSVLKRGNLQARFKPIYHESIHGRDDEHFKVTKEYIENFKNNVIIEI